MQRVETWFHPACDALAAESRGKNGADAAKASSRDEISSMTVPEEPLSFIHDVEFRPLGDFAVQRSTTHAHQLSGPGSISARLQQRLPQQPLFVFLDGE